MQLISNIVCFWGTPSPMPIADVICERSLRGAVFGADHHVEVRLVPKVVAKVGLPRPLLHVGPLEFSKRANSSFRIESYKSFLELFPLEVV